MAHQWASVYKHYMSTGFKFTESEYSSFKSQINPDYLIIINSKCLLRDGGLYPEVWCKIAKLDCHQ